MLAMDRFIEKNGEPVTIHKFTTLVYDDYDNVDIELSKFKSEKTFMLVGARKSETPNLAKQPEGWDYQDNQLIVFFPSTVSVEPEEGIDAHIVETRNGKRFRVDRTDFDYILGIQKKKVFLEPLRGDITA